MTISMNLRNFKLCRTTSLVLAFWSILSLFFMIFSKLERITCCSIGANQYRLYSSILWFIELKSIRISDCACEVDDFYQSFWIIPIEFIVLALLFTGAFIYLQFYMTIKDEFKKN